MVDGVIVQYAGTQEVAMSPRTCFLALVSAAALCGCATKPSSATPQQPFAYRTGSLIAVPASDVTKPGFGPSQSVSQQDLTRTGQLDIGSALKTLVPQAR
jgi:hypothetical protein